MDLQERIARIDRAQEETRQFAAEQDALVAKDARTLWLFPLGGMVIGAALFGAGMVFAKLIRA
ncbi:putative membrane protein YedE/YeeE [Bradyrhizobium sp. USDA 4369]